MTLSWWVIQVYITSAYRAYELADHYRTRGAYVALGGLHVTSLPDEAAQHADSIFLGPGEDIWPAFLADYREGHPEKVYKSQVRTLLGVPRIRRDVIKRNLYLVPNSIEFFAKLVHDRAVIGQTRPCSAGIISLLERIKAQRGVASSSASFSWPILKPSKIRWSSSPTTLTGRVYANIHARKAARNLGRKVAR